MNDDADNVETAREAGGRHCGRPVLRIVNEEDDFTKFHNDHVENHTVDGMEIKHNQEEVRAHPQKPCRMLPWRLQGCQVKNIPVETQQKWKHIVSRATVINIDVHISDTEEMTRIPEITSEELQDAIRKLKKGKSPDSDGIRAEDIKACDEETKEMVRQIFNEIIRQNEFTLEAWKRVKKVLHKKGDVENVGNYRPICSLLALYKLFSTILYERLHPRLDHKQAEDQAGFRSSYQTTDHLATYRMFERRCHEWCIKMWIATIDFTKAFDSILHKSIWKALDSCGINH